MDITKDVENSAGLDEDQDDMVKAAACLLAVAAVKKARAREMHKKTKKERKKRSVWVREWLTKRNKYGMYHKLMKHLRQGDEPAFKNFVRIDPEMFNQMVDDLMPRLQKTNTNFRKSLSVGLKLAITLRYLATGDSYKSLSYGFRVAPNSIVTVVADVCQAIYAHYHEKAFKFPASADEWKKVAQGFSDKWNFHHCCGCIDGKHVRIQAPPKSGSVYYNYKGFYSIIMLALVDSNYKFMYVDVGGYGADSDAGIFRECGLYHALEHDIADLPPSEPLPGSDTDVPYFLVGDDAFPLREWMMKPHSKREMMAAERIFNYRLSRARRIVENAFGILANRYVQNLHFFHLPKIGCKYIERSSQIVDSYFDFIMTISKAFLPMPKTN